MLSKNGVDPNSVGVIGVGLGATAVVAMEQGTVDAAIMLDPAVTILQGQDKQLKILSDTRSQKDTLSVFGGEYPGGALYTRADWIATHEKEVQALTNAIIATLKWIHTHTPEEIADKMPENLVGKDKALYVAALKNTLPMFSETGRMDPKGAAAVLAGRCQGEYRPVENLHKQIRRRSEQDDRDEVGVRSEHRIRIFALMAGHVPAIHVLR